MYEIQPNTAASDSPKGVEGLHQVTYKGVCLIRRLKSVSADAWSAAMLVSAAAEGLDLTMAYDGAFQCHDWLVVLQCMLHLRGDFQLHP